MLVLTDFEYKTINDTQGLSIECPIYAEHGLTDPVLIPLTVLGGIAGKDRSH